MTAPAAPSAVADITGRIAVIQATLASLSRSPVSATDATTPTGSDFSTQYSSALAAATPTASTSSATSATSGGVTGADVVAEAKRYLGVPYVWGAESMHGIDCSGLVQATYRDLGVKLPRIAADQAHEGTAVASLAQAQPGDLLTFGEPAYHIAIYLGNNKLIESPEPGKTVHITDVYQKPTSIRRILPTQAFQSSVQTFGAQGASGVPPVNGVGLSASQITGAGLNSSVASYAGQFAAAEQAHHLPTGLLAAVAQQESGGNPRALSPAGAQGLMQLMPSTAAGMGVNAYDPAQAITAAAKILHANLREFGSVPLALAAYNAGGGAVHRYGGIPPFTETQNYVKNIVAMMRDGG